MRNLKHETTDDASAQVNNGRIGSLAGVCTEEYVQALLLKIRDWEDSVKRYSQSRVWEDNTRAQR